jgi:hypothetical protein
MRCSSCETIWSANIRKLAKDQKGYGSASSDQFLKKTFVTKLRAKQQNYLIVSAYFKEDNWFSTSMVAKKKEKKDKLQCCIHSNPNNPNVILRFAILTPERLSR